MVIQPDPLAKARLLVSLVRAICSDLQQYLAWNRDHDHDTEEDATSASATTGVVPGMGPVSEVSGGTGIAEPGSSSSRPQRAASAVSDGSTGASVDTPQVDREGSSGALGPTGSGSGPSSAGQDLVQSSTTRVRVSADDLVGLFRFIMHRASGVEHLHAELAFMEDFMDTVDAIQQPGFYLTTLQVRCGVLCVWSV